MNIYMKSIIYSNLNLALKAQQKFIIAKRYMLFNYLTYIYSIFFLNQLSKCCHVGISHWLFDSY
jgi:hypothetical protein